MEPKEKETAGGVGPGITGASGDIIEGTGHNQGVGGTGHDNDADAAGMRPQDEYTARPDARQPEGDAPKGVSSTPLSGSASGGDPNAVPASGDTGPGRPGGGVLARAELGRPHGIAYRLHMISRSPACLDASGTHRCCPAGWVPGPCPGCKAVA